MPLLEITDLQTHFFSRRGVLKAVDGVSLSVEPGEVVAIVGESGCGKSVTAFSILGLVPNPPGRIVGGSIRFDGQELVGLDARAMRALRGDRIGMIFQEPMTSLNPALTIGEQIGEVLVQHRGLTRRQAATRAVELLDLVRVPDAAAPHRRLPAPAFRRHAATGDDRHGDRLRTPPADRRRADHGAGRDGAGAGAGAAAVHP